MCVVEITIFLRMFFARIAAGKLLTIIITVIHWDKGYETQQIFRPFSFYLLSGPGIEAAHLWIQS